jgi:hypothetical protein
MQKLRESFNDYPNGLHSQFAPLICRMVRDGKLPIDQCMVNKLIGTSADNDIREDIERAIAQCCARVYICIKYDSAPSYTRSLAPRYLRVAELLRSCQKVSRDVSNMVEIAQKIVAREFAQLS